MGTIEFKIKDGRYYIIQNINGKEQLFWLEIYEDDFNACKRINEIIEGRPHISQFPISKIKCKDRFEYMKTTWCQLEFFNDYWITREESLEIQKLLKVARDNFIGGDVFMFGSQPGFSVYCLMKDQGITQLPIY